MTSPEDPKQNKKPDQEPVAESEESEEKDGWEPLSRLEREDPND